MRANYCCCDVHLGSGDGGGALSLSDVTEEEQFLSLLRPTEILTEHSARSLPRHQLHKKKKRHQYLTLPSLTWTVAAHLLRNQPLVLLPRLKPKMVLLRHLHCLGLFQGHLENTGIEACPKHKMDHGVRDPNCDHCKRALGAEAQDQR